MGVVVMLAVSDVVWSKLDVTAEKCIYCYGGFPVHIGNILWI